MIATRRLPAKRIARMALPYLGYSAVWAAVVYAVYALAGWSWLRIPFLPLSTMGVAVSFYLGFKNNSAYDRFWEGRKIWGAVVNESRSWANAVLVYIRPGDTSTDAQELRRVMIYRHLAWINALRVQLRRKSRFFHNPARATKRRLENHAEHMRNDWDREMMPFLEPTEFTEVSAQINPATHIVAKQGQDLGAEVQADRLSLFHQIDMMAILRELYTLQGKCERIKNTPLPRQYAELGRAFVWAFVALVPFGLLDVFGSHLPATLAGPEDLPKLLPYLACSGLLGWVFNTMELIGDASEDPFERSFNDVPMNALCRTIERDLRQLLGETELPEPEAVIDDLLY